jgi:hypothetical protein
MSPTSQAPDLVQLGRRELQAGALSMWMAVPPTGRSTPWWPDVDEGSSPFGLGVPVPSGVTTIAT